MRLQMLVRQLLEVVQDLLLDDRCQALYLLNQDALLHLKLSNVGGSVLLPGHRFDDLAVHWQVIKRVLIDRLAAPLVFKPTLAFCTLSALGKLQLLSLQVEQARLFSYVVFQDG